MAYTFTKKPFVWNKEGVDPTSYEAALGLQGGMALPATFINQQWKRTYECIKEIQDKIEDGTIGGSGTDLSLTNSIRVGTKHTETATTNYAVFGKDNNTADNAFSCGRACKSITSPGDSGTTGDLFVIGNGTVDGIRGNAFKVTADGSVIGKKAYQTENGDTCHLLEWLDGNPNNEDRRGMFVTLDGDKIRPATSKDDYVLGVISATPSIICNAYTDDWHGKYVKDEYGANIVENGEYKISDDFDESKDDDYISRLERPEWGLVGHCGIVVARDDGTCQVNGYCIPDKNGIGTAASTGYRVMKRVSECLVEIFVSAPLIIIK